MNRYRAGGPSQASATTTCQKCLNKGHYSYECTASRQERPYVSRPSRSQQLSNPKLAPKLSATLPPADPKPEVKKSEPAVEEQRSRKRSIDDVNGSSAPKRRRSITSNSSGSVSTISTNRSRSRSQSPPRGTRGSRRRSSASREESSRGTYRRRDSSTDSRRRPERPNSRSRTERSPDSSRRRRESLPRSVRKRSTSPARRYIKRSRSRLPYRGDDRRGQASSRRSEEREAPPPRQQVVPPRPTRERSLSPYSQRVAMTRATGGS